MFNIICINLRDFNTKDEFAKFISDMNFDMDVDAYWDVKIGKWNGTKVWRIWIDSTTFNMVAFESRQEQNFASQFLEHLLNMEPIRPGDLSPVLTQKTTQVKNESMSIDSLLDKISLKGINSLSKEEKDFLDNNNS